MIKCISLLEGQGMCPLTGYCVILSTSSITANSVECFFLKPY